MTHHPVMVADKEFDTELMLLTQGELVSKAGAEGIQCIGRIGEGMGLAIKVMDGAKRASCCDQLTEANGLIISQLPGNPS